MRGNSISNDIMKIVVGIIRVVVGVLFIFSGLVKANDPLGLCYKMQEFFSVLHLNFLAPAALTLAIIMIGFEIIAGVALLLGFKMRIFGTLLLLLMILFLFLTAYAFLSGKIKECGCFGDCIPLTAETSFWKDVVLFVLVLILFANRRRIRPVFGRFFTGLLMVIGIVAAFGFQLFTLNHLPVVDCLAYKIGNNIPALMQIPPGATPDKYATVFVYEKDGTKKEFPADDIPWQDTTWHFVSREDKLVQKGDAEPLIKDFVITGFSGSDSTGTILSDNGYTFLFMVKDVSKAGRGWKQKMAHLEADCKRYGVKIYGITASDAQGTAQFKKAYGLTFPFLQMDATVIKTAARSNPCLILLKKGTIKAKWHYHDMPQGAIPSPNHEDINLKF
jgi:uncharacterized membrane protein YphA (DoxX/SURF4 family)